MTDNDDDGWDAQCDFCETRMSWPDDEGGNGRLGDENDVNAWAHWHRKECEPTIRTLSPVDLKRERQQLERLRARYPEVYGKPGDDVDCPRAH